MIRFPKNVSILFVQEFTSSDKVGLQSEFQPKNFFLTFFAFYPFFAANTATVPSLSNPILNWLGGWYLVKYQRGLIWTLPNWHRAQMLHDIFPLSLQTRYVTCNLDVHFRPAYIICPFYTRKIYRSICIMYFLQMPRNNIWVISLR